MTLTCRPTDEAQIGGVTPTWGALKIALVGFPRRLAVPSVLLGAANEDAGIRGIRIGHDGLLAPGEGWVVSQA